MRHTFKSTARWILNGALLLAAPAMAIAWPGSLTVREQLRNKTEQQIKNLGGKFAEALTPSAKELELRNACQLDCSAIAEAQTGATVAMELEGIARRRLQEEDRIAAQIEKSVRRYIEQFSLDPEQPQQKALERDLRVILASVSDGPPWTMVSETREGPEFVVFYVLKKGMAAGDGATSAVLTAYATTAEGLRFSGQTDCDMNGYADVSVKVLSPPVAGEIWILLSGQMTGANGPNTRMRAIAFDGKQFRSVWKPANVWGDFTTKLTENGFSVDGSYYRPNRPRHERYTLAPGGVYRVPSEH
jgi:hypothetical protein